MKKLMILAMSALLAANICAQEIKPECKKNLSKEERIEFDIKRFTHELYLSDKQAEAFAVTYREYAQKINELMEKNKPAVKPEPGKELKDSELDALTKQRFEFKKEMISLQEKYYAKFRKDLNARQAAKVVRLDEPFGPKQCCGHDGKKACKHHGEFKPECGKGGPQPPFQEK